MLDANLTFGLASSRYNARDKYRREYSSDQRLGAGVGTALGVALPVAAGVSWMQKGMRVPGVSSGLMRNVGRATGLGMLGLATGVGVKRSIDIAKDDGHLGAAGTAVGVIGGAVAGNIIGRQFGGTVGAISTTAGAIVGGVAGNFGGHKVKIGEGHLGEANVQLPQVDHNGVDRTRSFARGAFNHFSEVGPATQGVSFGPQWGMREAVKERYSNSERAGAMHGDLLAAGIMGSGALAVSAGLMGLSKHAGKGVSNLRVGANAAGGVLANGVLTRITQNASKAGIAGAASAAVGITALSAWKGFDTDRANMGTKTASMIAAGTVAATAGTAAFISRSSAFATMAPKAKAANSALVAAALISVLASARLPLQQFMNDAKDAHAVSTTKSTPVMATAAGVGALGGGIGAFKGLSKLVPASGVTLGRFHLPKAALVGTGTALGAAALGGAGYGLSATMPDIKKVGISVAAGAGAGLAAGAFARGIGVVPGLVGGAALGLSASSLLNSGSKIDSEREIELAPGADRSEVSVKDAY